MTPTEIAPEVYRLNINGMVNAYLLGNARGWVLVDTGVAGQFEYIRDAADQQFGVGAKPDAIILTHGHGDHAGSALGLATFWDVPVYAHRMELPFLTGKSNYPPVDPTTGGPFAFLLRFTPHMMYGSDFGETVRALPEDGSVPGLSEDWRFIETPGHTPGHVSLWRERDAVLVAGDAVATVYIETLSALLSRRSDVSPPAAPVTPDWYTARKSIEKLAALEPKLVTAGHGEPVLGASATAGMRRLADMLRVPQHGRYVTEPAEFDEQGVRYLPPVPKDPLPVVAGIALGAVAIGFGLWAVAKQKNKTI
ncbi:MAG: MBL fold metallo-hydrolase [Akkermansiaceae bacterium]|nr:MBL fold metallo-hydrolase [Armatimonadota bacterium]